jgi:hypothetical protein
MNLTNLKNLATSGVGRQLLTLQKNSPRILFAAGVTGVVVAAVLACRATLKVEEVLDEHEELIDRADGQQAAALVYFRTATKLSAMYAPAVIIGAASIAALTGAHVTLTRRNAAAVAAYAALDKGFRAYRARVVAELGEEKDREYRYGAQDKEIVEETEQGPKVSTIQVAGPEGASIYARWFDDSCSAWQKQPEYNRIFLKCQQNYANDMLNARGHVLLNDVYDMLGLKRSQPGTVVGWVKGDGDGYIDFGIFNGETHTTRDFVNGWSDRVLLDFNVDGIIYDKI